MDAVLCGGGAISNEQNSKLVTLEAQGEGRSPKSQVLKDVIRCDECDRSFVELPVLERHKERDHALRKPHRCNACGQEFALLSSLNLHKRSNATLNCQFCQQIFPCTTSLAAHLLQQHSADPECRGLEGLPFNYQLHHQDCGPYACAPCGRDFTQKPALLHHQQAGCYTLSDLQGPWLHTGMLKVSSLTPHNPNPPSLPSSLDPIATSSLPVACRPPSSTRSRVCSLCPRAFRSQAGLACHQRLRHPLEWKRAQARFWKQGGDRFPCPSCDKVFCHSPSLSQHKSRCHLKKMKGKTQAKQEHKSQLFPCRSCDMVFSQTSKLYLHRKEQHRRQETDGEHRLTGESGQTKKKEVYPCHLCSKVFPDTFSHWAHLQNHRAQQRKTQKSKGVCNPSKEQVAHRRVFQCPQCDKSYRHRCNLSRHLHTHSKTSQKPDSTWRLAKEIGESPGEMEGRRNIKDDQGNREWQREEDEGAFPCTSCEKVFSFHTDLKEHEQVHQSMEGVSHCSVCSHGMGSFRGMGRNVAGFYHCVPCKHAFRKLSVFLQHCEMHLFPSSDNEGGTNGSSTDD